MFPLPEELRGRSGPGTLVFRPEDVEVGGEGTPLPLSARLFLGHAAEYRFPVGDTLLRVVGPPSRCAPGQVLQVRIRKAKLFPPRVADRSSPHARSGGSLGPDSPGSKVMAGWPGRRIGPGHPASRTSRRHDGTSPRAAVASGASPRSLQATGAKGVRPSPTTAGGSAQAERGLDVGQGGTRARGDGRVS